MAKAVKIEGYNMKLKKKEVLKNPVISQTKKGGFMVKGTGSDGTGV